MPKDVKTDAGVTSTSEPGGKEPDPTDQTPVSPTPGDEPQAKPPEGKVDEPKDKQVPFESYEAERIKRQALEDELNTLKEKPPEPAFNWDALMGGDTSNQEPAPAQQPVAGEQSANPFDPYNQWLRNNWDEHPVQAMLGVLNLYDSQKRQQETQARQFVGEDKFRDLPMHNVSDQELMAFAQNPVAQRAAIAALKSMGPSPAPGDAGPATTNALEDQRKTWEAQREKEIREKVLKELQNAPGVTTEGAAGPTGPGETVYELDEAGKAYAKKRGIDKDPAALKEFAKRYNAELERQSSR